MIDENGNGEKCCRTSVIILAVFLVVFLECLIAGREKCANASCSNTPCRTLLFPSQPPRSRKQVMQDYGSKVESNAEMTIDSNIICSEHVHSTSRPQKAKRRGFLYIYTLCTLQLSKRKKKERKETDMKRKEKKRGWSREDACIWKRDLSLLKRLSGVALVSLGHLCLVSGGLERVRSRGQRLEHLAVGFLGLCFLSARRLLPSSIYSLKNRDLVQKREGRDWWLTKGTPQ